MFEDIPMAFNFLISKAETKAALLLLLPNYFYLVLITKSKQNLILYNNISILTAMY